MARVTKPTPQQRVLIQKRLREKYPHMASEAWLTRLKGKVQRQLRQADPLKRNANPATAKIIDQLRSSGNSDSDIARVLGIKA